MDNHRTLLIRDLNDRFRTRLEGGRLLFAGDLAQATQAVLQQALAETVNFSDFSAANDPSGLHDFGDFMLGGRHVFWQIEYFDIDDARMERTSADPADPALTTRVLTISYAEDFEGDR